MLKISEKYALYESLFCVIKLNTFIRTGVKIGQQQYPKTWLSLAESRSFSNFFCKVNFNFILFI